MFFIDENRWTVMAIVTGSIGNDRDKLQFLSRDFKGGEVTVKLAISSSERLHLCLVSKKLNSPD